MIKNTTTDVIKRMAGSEGLILQGCEGDPAEWLERINNELAKHGAFKNGFMFKDAYVFEHGRAINILFPVESIEDNFYLLNLEAWQYFSYTEYGGTWLSDYLPNRLGIDIDAPAPWTIRVEFGFVGENNERLSEFLDYPAPQEKIDRLKKKAGVNELLDQVFYIESMETVIPGLEAALPDALDTGDINRLAKAIRDMNNEEREKFTDIIAAKQYYGGIREITNLAENLDSHELKSPPLRVYMENVHDDSISGFTMPLPATPEMFQEFFKDAEIAGWQDLEIIEVYSDINGLGEALTETIKKTMSPDALDELNYLAARIQDLQDSHGRDMFAAMVESKRYLGGTAELINLTFTENMNRFDLLPALTNEHYGDFLIEQLGIDAHADAFYRLENSDEQEDKELAKYIEKLEKYVDRGAYGRDAIKEENGILTEAGLLMGGDDIQTLYHGSQDIPAEYRIFTQPGEAVTPPMKIDDVDIAATLVKIHAACCVGMSGAADSLKMLTGDHRPYGDFLLMVNKESVSLFHPIMAYERGGITEKTIRHWAEMLDTKFFNVRVNDRGDNTGRDMRGDFIELNTNALLANMARHTVMPERVEAVRHDGFSKSYDLVAWAEVSQSQLSEIKDVTHHYPIDGLVEASRRYGNFAGANEMSSDARGFDDYFPVLCAPYMAAAANPQPDMIRVTNEAAKELLARGDADVYRLTPGGAEKLAQIEAARAVSFAKNHEVAIKREDAPGLDKWAKRTADKLLQQAERGERDKSKHKGEEL